MATCILLIHLVVKYVKMFLNYEFVSVVDLLSPFFIYSSIPLKFPPQYQVDQKADDETVVCSW